MANKSSSIARKLWLANGSAVLAIASLFSIGFSAWAEVGGETTAELDSNVNISVENHGVAELLDTSNSVPFIIYPTGCSQVSMENSTSNRTYTDTPYITFYLFFKFVHTNISCSISFDLQYVSETEDKYFVPAEGFTYYEDFANQEPSNAVFDNSNLEQKSTNKNTIQYNNISDIYYSMKVMWTVNVIYSNTDGIAKYADFYKNIGTKTHSFILSVSTEA